MELYLANTYTSGRVTSSIHLCIIPPYGSFENRIESFGPKFKVEEDDHYSCRKTRMIDLSYGIMIMWAEVSFILSQFTCLTNVRTNIFCIQCSTVKKPLSVWTHIFARVEIQKYQQKYKDAPQHTVVSNSLCWENVEDDRICKLDTQCIQ